MKEKNPHGPGRGRRTGGCRRKKACRHGAGSRPKNQPAEGAEPGSMGAGRDDARPFPRPSEKRAFLRGGTGRSAPSAAGKA
ncbi:MAG: hypothetical protein LUG84_05040, partial [Akkermansiaceae bacterium]|nr:hypothetical protein [Akkermansiaceae bacterium]